MKEPYLSGEAQVSALLSSDQRVDPDTTLPGIADVVIIGGGIVGCSAALFLARKGVRVVVCEKGVLAGEQSGRNWGWVRQQGRAAAELPLMMRSAAIWQDWTQTLGEDTGYQRGGCLYLARTAAELDGHRAWLEIAREHELDTRLLNSAQVGSMLGGSATWAGALYTPTDGRAEPNRATPAIARAAVKAGARVLSACAVRGVETAAGNVSAVITERGSIRCSQVVCAAGAWTSLFAGSLNICVPQLKVKGTVARTVPAAHLFDGTVWAPEVALRRRADGGYTVAHGHALEHSLVPSSVRFGLRYLPAFLKDFGGIRMRLDSDFLREFRQARRWALDRPTVFERERTLHPAPTPRLLARARAAMESDFPALAGVAFAETWAGMIEASPDLIPVISPADRLPGFYIATGFSGHGFGLGPGAGELVAEMVTGNAAPGALHPFRLSRYFDGSRLVPGPSI